MDDDETERLMILRFFERMAEDVLVEEAENGEAAIERMRVKGFDMILSDYRMGAVTGIDLLAFARVFSPTTVRILLSGYASGVLREQAKRLAAVHAVVEKPMTPPELYVVLEEQVVRPFVLPLVRADASSSAQGS